MGLLDGLLGGVLGGKSGQSSNPLESILSGITGGDASKSGGLLTAVMGMLQQNGGLGKLVDMFKQNGLGKQVESWIGTGKNQSVSPSQIQKALGSANLGDIASKLGVSQSEAGITLSKLMPELVNKLTPDGKLPADEGDLLSKGLDLLKGGR